MFIFLCAREANKRAVVFLMKHGVVLSNMTHGDIRRGYMNALTTGTCAITSTSSSVLSNDRSRQRTAIYSAKSDTPCSAVCLRQLSCLLIGTGWK